MDLYTAERFATYRHAQLIADARQSALDAVWARQMAERVLSIHALRAVGTVLLRAATHVWNGGVRAAALVRAGR